VAKYLATSSGVPLIDPETGKAGYYPEAEALKRINEEGWQPTSVEAAEVATRAAAEDARWAAEPWSAQGDLQQMAEGRARGWRAPVAAGLAGVARGLSLGASDVIGRALDPGATYGKLSTNLREENPWASGLGEVAGSIGGAFIPGAPVALALRGGKVAGAAAKAALGGGKVSAAVRAALEGGEALKAAGAAGELGAGFLGSAGGAAARGLAEGSAFGLGAAATEIATTPREITGEGVKSALGHGLLYGALLGGGLTLGIEGVAGAGKWALAKAGLGKTATKLVEARAAQAAELEAATANKQAIAADLETQALPLAARNASKAEVSSIEAEAAQRAKQIAKLAPGAVGEEDALAVANRELGASAAARDAKAQLADIAKRERDLLKQIAEADREAASALEVEARPPTPIVEQAKKAGKVDVGLEVERQRLAGEEKALAKLRRGDAAGTPPLERRLDEAIAKLGESYPDAASAAAGKDGFEKKLGRIWKFGREEAPDGRLWDGPHPSSPEAIGSALDTMERRLGMAVHLDAGKKIAASEYRILTGTRKLEKALETGAAKKALTPEAPFSAPPAPASESSQQWLVRGEEFRKELAGLQQERVGLEGVFGGGKAILDASEERARQKLVDQIAASAEAQTGKAARLQTLRAQLEQQDGIIARLKALKGDSAEEAAARAALLETDAKLRGGKGGLIGRIAQATAKRSLTWAGARGIGGMLGGSGGGMLRGGMGSILPMSAGLEISRALAPRLVRGLTDLVAPGAGVVSKVGGSVFGGAAAVGRVLSPAVKARAASRHLSDDEFKAVAADLAIPLSAWETSARAALMGEDETLVNSVVSAHAKQRAFLASKLPRDPRKLPAANGDPTIPLGGKWKPSPVEDARFAVYVCSATHWRNVVEDLVDRRATPESMETLRACYPEVAQALRTYVANGVRKAAAEGKRYGAGAARMLDLVMGPPYQLTQNVATFQATFAPQKRVQPSRGAGASAITLSKSLANQLQQGQPGLGTR
jgi:hypothetical protein